GLDLFNCRVASLPNQHSGYTSEPESRNYHMHEEQSEESRSSQVARPPVTIPQMKVVLE
ncbi:hypothetical protein SK128_005310, partial [Halocaridina rubra]